MQGSTFFLIVTNHEEKLLELICNIELNEHEVHYVFSLEFQSIG